MVKGFTLKLWSCDRGIKLMFERLWVRVHPADIRIDILSYRILCTNCNSSNSLDLKKNLLMESTPILTLIRYFLKEQEHKHDRSFFSVI